MLQTKVKKQKKKSPPKPQSAQVVRKPSKQKRPMSAIGTIARVVGGAVGYPGIGNAIGQYADKIFGRGEYTIQQNTLKDTNAPVFSSDGAIRVRKREFVADISGSVAFATQLIAGINPANSTLFPWLSTIATQFEEYTMEGLAFHFHSTSSNALNSTNTALGVVVMTTEYDTLKAPFTTKQQMEEYEYSVSTKPSESALHLVECAPQHNPLNQYFVYNRDLPSIPLGADPHLYNMGNFQLSTVGMQAAAVIGELWVTYDIVLKKPRLGIVNNNIGDNIHVSSLLADGGTGTSLSLICGAGNFSISPNGITGGIYAVKINTNSVVQDCSLVYNPTVNGQFVLTNLNKLSPRMFLILMSAKADVALGTASVSLVQSNTFTNSTSVALWCNASQRNINYQQFPQSNGGTSPTPQCSYAICVLLNPDGTYVFNLATLASAFAGATNASFDMLITELPSNLTVSPPTLEDYTAELQLRSDLHLPPLSYEAYCASSKGMHRQIRVTKDSDFEMVPGTPANSPVVRQY